MGKCASHSELRNSTMAPLIMGLIMLFSGLTWLSLVNSICYLYNSRKGLRNGSVSPPDRGFCGVVAGARLWLGAACLLQVSVSGGGTLAAGSSAHRSRIRDSQLLPHPEAASGPVLPTLRLEGWEDCVHLSFGNWSAFLVAGPGLWLVHLLMD